MRITYIGHASYLIEAGADRILCDPVLSDENVAGGLLTACPARTVETAAMPRPTAIGLSHGHADHFHPPSWRDFSSDVPVLVPAVPYLLRRLEKMGFTRLVPLQDWQTHPLASLQVTATPSQAEETPEVGFLFRSGERSFWNMVDSHIRAEAISPLGHLEIVAARYQPVLVQRQILLGQGSAFDKAEVQDWLESSLEPRPEIVFPAASGMAYPERDLGTS